jgi:hypothetical protein
VGPRWEALLPQRSRDGWRGVVEAFRASYEELSKSPMQMAPNPLLMVLAPAANFVDRTDEGQPWGSGPGHRAPGGRTPVYPRGARPCWPRQPLFLHSE